LKKLSGLLTFENGSAVSTQPKTYKGGAPIALTADLDAEQEEAVLAGRHSQNQFATQFTE